MALNGLGYTRANNGGDNGQRRGDLEQIPKSRPVRICTLQLDVHEVGIASNRGSACRGEYVPGPCTQPPVTSMGVGFTRRRCANLLGGSRPR